MTELKNDETQNINWIRSIKIALKISHKINQLSQHAQSGDTKGNIITSGHLTTNIDSDAAGRVTDTLSSKNRMINGYNGSAVEIKNEVRQGRIGKRRLMSKL